MTDTTSITSTTSTTSITATARETAHGDCERKLRLVLRANACNSILFGTLLAAIPHHIDELLDTGHPGWIRVVGLALIPFGALCAWLSTASSTALRRVTPQIVIGDVAWVIASIATVLLGWYSGGGILAVLAMAVIVDAFALLQLERMATAARDPLTEIRRICLSMPETNEVAGIVEEAFRLVAPKTVLKLLGP